MGIKTNSCYMEELALLIAGLHLKALLLKGKTAHLLLADVQHIQTGYYEKQKMQN